MYESFFYRILFQTLISVLPLSIHALELMADEQDSFISICSSLHTLITTLAGHGVMIDVYPSSFLSTFQYSIIKKLIDSYYAALDLEKKHTNEKKYFTYIYDISDKQWLYLSDLIFSLPSICSVYSIVFDSNSVDTRIHNPKSHYGPPQCVQCHCVYRASKTDCSSGSAKIHLSGHSDLQYDERFDVLFFPQQ